MPAPPAPRRPPVLALALAAGLALLVACPGADSGGEHPLSLTLKFDRNGLAGCLNCLTVDDCALDCGGVVGVFLVDASSDVVIDKRCRPLPARAGATLRSLPGHLAATSLVNNVSVGRRVVVELAVFSPSPFAAAPGPDAGTDPPCERPVVGSDGLPVTSDENMHYPSFWGRSQPVTLRADDNPVTVSLSCVSDRPACATRPDALFSAQVIDMETQLAEHPDTPQTSPRGLDVRFGNLLSTGGGAVAFQTLVELNLPDQLPAPPEWTKLVPTAFYNPSCLATRVTRIDPQIGPQVVSCEGTEKVGQAGEASRVTTIGYTIDKVFVDGLLPQLATGAVPEHGMILGKVVDGTGGPVKDAVVEPLTGSAVVVYLDEDDNPSGTLTATSASGWFVVETAPSLPGNCCEIFRARRGADLGCTGGPVGTVNGTIMAARIVVDPSNPTCQSSP